VGRDERRALLGSAIHIGGNQLPVPVELFRSVGVVAHVHADRHPLFEAEKRSRELPVVSRDGNDAVWSQLDRLGGDAEGIISFRLVRLQP
jgi:hypothetical protein